MSRIFVTGDTHGGQAGDMKKLNARSWKTGRELSKEDYLIVVGDFGCVWSNPIAKSYKQDLYVQRWLHEKPWTTLFIDGNHDNHNVLKSLELVDMFGSKVGKVNDSIYHLKRGEVYNIHGKTFFTMGGAESMDKENRIEGISWWKEEIPSYAEMDRGLEILEKNNWKVDYVLTHNCPEFIAKMFISMNNAKGLYNTKVNDPTSNYLEHIRSKLEFKKWYYGHWHSDWGYDKFRMLYQFVVEIGGKNDPNDFNK